MRSENTPHKDDHAAETITILVALECPHFWNGLKKRRVILTACSTGAALQTAILSECSTLLKEKRHAVDDLSETNASIEIYDTLTDTFASLATEDNTARFGRTIRARLFLEAHSEEHDNEQASKENDEILALTGRFFPYDTETGVIPFHSKELVIFEVVNSGQGTGLNLWDGSFLLARYLEQNPVLVRGKGVLELGAGVGFVGISAAVLGAREVVLTDLDYTMQCMEENVRRNMMHIQSSGCKRIECKVCDWFCPPESIVESFGFRSKTDVEVILVADCVWLEELVSPLFHTIDVLLQHNERALVIISYQRRGAAAHTHFWDGLHARFHISLVNTALHLLHVQDVFYLMICTNKNLHLGELAIKTKALL